MHTKWIKKYQFSGAYSLYRVPPEDLKLWLKKLISENVIGLNVTMPHKVEVIKYIDEIDPIAEKTGSVNTIKVCSRGLLKGFNTDVYGFEKNLHAHAPDIFLKNKKVLILGAGGVARSCIVSLKQMGAKIFICNRTFEKTKNLCDTFSLTPLKWGEIPSCINETSLLVNCTSIGMSYEDSLAKYVKLLNKSAYVYDIVYKPHTTPLIKKAQEKGNPVIFGKGMLEFQAKKSFEIWTGILPT